MRLSKQKGLVYSEYVYEMISNYLSDYDEIEGRVETYYNCREQGYVFEIHNKDYNKNICIWIAAQRNSDEPMVVWCYDNPIPKEMDNTYDEDSYYNRNETFKYVEQAVEKVEELIKEYFELGR